MARLSSAIRPSRPVPIHRRPARQIVSGIVQFLRQGGRPLSNYSALHSDHYHGAFYSAKSEWHVQSTILTPTVDDQTLDRQVDFAELGVIHSITVAAILPTTRHERG